MSFLDSMAIYTSNPSDGGSWNGTKLEKNPVLVVLSIGLATTSLPILYGVDPWRRTAASLRTGAQVWMVKINFKSFNIFKRSMNGWVLGSESAPAWMKTNGLDRIRTRKSRLFRAPVFFRISYNQGKANSKRKIKINLSFNPNSALFLLKNIFNFYSSLKSALASKNLH